MRRLRIRCFRNPHPSPRFKYGRLPVRQHLIWLGPVFIQVKVMP